MKFQGYRCTYRFNAYHNISDDVSKKHSHTFWVNIFLECETDDFTTFSIYEKIVNDYFDNYKGKYLNDFECFKENKPTLENMCKKFYEDIDKIFLDIKSLDVVKLELGDSPLKSVSVGEKIIAGTANLLIPSQVLNKFIANNKKGDLF